MKLNRPFPVTDLIPVIAVGVQDCQPASRARTDAVSLNLPFLKRSKHKMSISVQTNGAWYTHQLSFLNPEKGALLGPDDVINHVIVTS